MLSCVMPRRDRRRPRLPVLSCVSASTRFAAGPLGRRRAGSNRKNFFRTIFRVGSVLGGVLSVVATSVYGMDHTGDNHHDGVEGSENGADAGRDVDAVSGVDVP